MQPAAASAAPDRGASPLTSPPQRGAGVVRVSLPLSCCAVDHQPTPPAPVARAQSMGQKPLSLRGTWIMTRGHSLDNQRICEIREKSERRCGNACCLGR